MVQTHFWSLNSQLKHICFKFSLFDLPFRFSMVEARSDSFQIDSEISSSPFERWMITPSGNCAIAEQTVGYFKNRISSHIIHQFKDMQRQRHKNTYMRSHYLTKSGGSPTTDRKVWQFQFDDSLISQSPKVEISDTTSIGLGNSLLLPHGIPALYSKKPSDGSIRMRPFQSSKEDCRNHLVRNLRSSSSKNEEKTQTAPRRTQTPYKKADNSNNYQLLVLTNDKKNIIFSKKESFTQVKRIERSITEKDHTTFSQQPKEDSVGKVKKVRARRFSVCSVTKSKVVLLKKTSDTTNDTIGPWEQYKEEDLLF